MAPACAGSNPVLPPIYEHVSQRPKEAGCNPVVRWFESSRALHYGKVAQSVERSVEARKAAGSIPAFTTNSITPDNYPNKLFLSESHRNDPADGAKCIYRRTFLC